MKMIVFLFLILTSFLIFAEDTTQTKEIKIIKVSVMDLKAEIGIDEKIVNLLYEVSLTEFQKYKNVSIISKTDIASMLKHEAQKELTGCNEDSCMAEIGGALGVDKVVLGNVGKIGESYTISFKLMDIRNAKVEKRVSKTIPANQDKLVPLVKVLANELFDSYKEFRTEPFEKIDLEEEPTKIFTWITLGTSIVCLGVGGYFYYKADTFYEGNMNQNPSDLEDDYYSVQMWRNIFLITGGLGLIGSGVLYFIEGKPSSETKSSFNITPFFSKDNFFVLTSFSF